MKRYVLFGDIDHDSYCIVDRYTKLATMYCSTIQKVVNSDINHEYNGGRVGRILEGYYDSFEIIYLESDDLITMKEFPELLI